MQTKAESQPSRQGSWCYRCDNL